ncbi:MAG: cysteine desulfurase [Nitrospirae bacterium]|nr:MAG: cysteine desulfurase [Nitrospirota bacterium]
MIYLDHNATTPIDERVKEAICESLHLFGNPSSGHIEGKKAREVIEQARESVASLIGASTDEVFFTSCGTESNNLAILGYLKGYTKGHIISSQIEHPSVLKALRHAESLGFDVTLIPPEGTGSVDPDAVLKAMKRDTLLVTLMHANNETGVIQPVVELGRLLKERGITFHVDAAQSIGKVDVKVSELNADLLTVAPHKFYAPKGVGALYIRKGTQIAPILYGGGQERGLRPGTENTHLIAGLGRAADIIRDELPQIREHLLEVTERLYTELISKIDGIEVNGVGEKIPNTMNLSIKGVTGRALVSSLAHSVAFSAGSACHEGKDTPSEVLISMGLSRERAVSAVRISTGRKTTIADVITSSELIARETRRLRETV